jgi:methyl-accepting chemotaxis protein
MDHTTQQNASLVEEAATATTSMAQQAGELAHAVDVFKLSSSDLAVSAVETHRSAPVVRLVQAPPRSTVATSAPSRVQPPVPGTAKHVTPGNGWESF